MSFPTTLVKDSFTGANGVDLPAYNGAWSVQSDTGNLEIQGNAATGTSTGFCSNIWNVQNSGPDCEIYVTMVTKPANGESLIGFIRLQQEGAIATSDGYIFQFDTNAGTDSIWISRLDDGVGTVIGVAQTQEFADGDGIGLEMIVDTLQVYRKPSGGSWVIMGTTRTDGTYTASGKIGLFCNSTTVRIDDFGGGTIGESVGAPDNRFKYRPNVESGWDMGQGYY